MAPIFRESDQQLVFRDLEPKLLELSQAWLGKNDALTRVAVFTNIPILDQIIQLLHIRVKVWRITWINGSTYWLTRNGRLAVREKWMQDTVHTGKIIMVTYRNVNIRAHLSHLEILDRKVEEQLERAALAQ